MEINAAALKAKGFFQQSRDDLYSLRLSSPGGTVAVKFLETAAEIARTYGEGKLHFTTRQQVEIPGIAAAHIETVQALLAGAGIGSFTGGPRVRAVCACQGAGICKFGQIETSALAREIHETWGGREYPAKIKIAVTGCKNNCAKVEANDIGIRGQGGGYLMYFGGSFGREIRIGKPFLPLLPEKQDVFKVTGGALDFYAARANKGERFGKCIDRAGEEAFRKALEAAL